MTLEEGLKYVTSLSGEQIEKFYRMNKYGDHVINMDNDILLKELEKFQVITEIEELIKLNNG